MSADAVQISDLSFTWPGGRSPAVELKTFKVAARERLFVQGASGSGKSTLLGLLAGVLTPNQGSVAVLGQKMSNLTASGRDRFRADHLGYIFQQFNLVPYLSVVENVTLPLRYSSVKKKRVQHPAEEARRLLDHLGMGSVDLIHRRVTELSVGQQQRVAAARALIGSPEILIADEPTSALDAANRQSFIELLFKECKETGASLIFVSHDFALAPMFDRAVQLEGGEPC